MQEMFRIVIAAMVMNSYGVRTRARYSVLAVFLLIANNRTDCEQCFLDRDTESWLAG